MSRFYITTAIDYANGDPHLGHAYEKIGADAIARYHRLRGDDVWFLIGMDEHGQKVAQTAEKQGVPPQQFVDEIANFRHNPRLPWVGSAAFAHKGGMHVNAVSKNPRTFEHIAPDTVGNKRRVLVSARKFRDLAGWTNQRIAQASNEVILMVAGMPIIAKKKLGCS